MRTFILISIPQAQSAGGIAGLISDLALRQMLFVEPASQTAVYRKTHPKIVMSYRCVLSL